jgi:acyl-coenzyme A synthetase/AMP-(fatty) acid ligase
MTSPDLISPEAQPSLPLLAHGSLDAVMAYRRGRAILVRSFLADVARVAAALPDSAHVLNVCTDRYHFAVGLAAAISRKQISLLPPSHNAEMVGQIRAAYPDVYALCEQPVPELDLPQTFYPAQPQAWAQAVEAEHSPASQIPEIDVHQIVACVFTSGSTGRPTEHVKRWGWLVRDVRIEAHRLGLSPGSGHSLVGTVPAQHMYGLESTVLVAWQGAAAIVAERPFYPADITAVLAALPAPRVLITTPFHLRAWLDEAPEGGARPDLILSATAPLSDSLAAQAEARCGAPLIEIYGSTETGQLATRRSAQTNQWLSFDGLSWQEREGRMWVSGGHVETPTPLNDVLTLCAPEPADHGAVRFVLLGRTADMVNVAGKRTSLSHLNLQLNAIEGVQDGAFFWPESDDADKLDGVTRLIAFVVAPGMSLAQLQAALRQRIDAAFMPRPLYLVDALPRNATGKLPHAALLALLGRMADGAGASSTSPAG